jgi:hypothetical protein
MPFRNTGLSKLNPVDEFFDIDCPYFYASLLRGFFLMVFSLNPALFRLSSRTMLSLCEQDGACPPQMRRASYCPLFQKEP